MITKPNDGGPAFPQGYLDGPEVDPSGMSLRAWFAGMAMQGLITNPDTVSEVEIVAKFSIQYADALIAELEKEKP